MVLTTDLKHMKSVMRRLGHLDQEDIVELKGKVACEISAGDELLITELIFRGIFNELQPAEVAGVLAALMHDENSSSEKAVVKEPKLSAVFDLIINEAKKIYQVYSDSKIVIEEKDYLATIKPHLVDIVYHWCKGKSFLEICKMGDFIFEGSIIRCMRRLDELLK
jgi:ATP-dependent RNA helicase DOB1